MDFEEHLEMARDPNNIPGIYNYCDGWCERCTFTSKCLNFKTRAVFEEEIEKEKREEENKAFWNEVDEALDDVKDLLDIEPEDDSESDFSLFDDFDDEDDAMKEHENHRQKAKAQPISQAGKRYMNIATDFFKKKEGSLDRFYTEDDKHEVTVEGITNEVTLRRISVAVQVAFYYHMQIWVKVNRALTSSYDDFEHDPEYADMPKDSDGSAKVALLGIDQSIAGWSTLYKYLESDQKEITDIVLLLKQLRRGIERVFPNARAFQRPGFDD